MNQKEFERRVRQWQWLWLLFGGTMFILSVIAGLLWIALVLFGPRM